MVEDAQETIEDMAQNGTGPEPEPEPEPEFVQGTTGQLSMAVGGRRPDTSHMVVRSTQRDVDGQYTKGDLVRVTLLARVDEIDFTDRHDEHGTVTACKRVHKAKPLTIESVVKADEG